MEVGSGPRHGTIVCFWLASLLLPLAVLKACYIYLHPLDVSFVATPAYVSDVQSVPPKQVSNELDLQQQHESQGLNNVQVDSEDIRLETRYTGQQGTRRDGKGKYCS